MNRYLVLVFWIFSVWLYTLFILNCNMTLKQKKISNFLSIMLITTNHFLTRPVGNKDALLYLLFRGKSKMQIHPGLFTQCFPTIKKIFYHLISLDDYHLYHINLAHAWSICHAILKTARL